MTHHQQDARLERITPAELRLPNPWDIPTRIFANADIPIETSAIDELQNVLKLQDTVNTLVETASDFFGEHENPQVREVVLTFTRGPGFRLARSWPLRASSFPKRLATTSTVECV